MPVGFVAGDELRQNKIKRETNPRFFLSSSQFNQTICSPQQVVWSERNLEVNAGLNCHDITESEGT